ncbi:glycosyltransferase family 2 protein [Streptococcus thermophilus]|uniref:Glycosyltransferase family 2 protein n=1 Tax=Thomasclavelia spiroformis TaxID=29348 RepID=A0A943ERM3_9FIRM|nr:glycosyltransferase family 2 protein [Streptococcus thermophilus]MBS5589220.1 glycosyltransferase family 2 protein [Thomasclavelia spiroformis]
MVSINKKEIEEYIVSVIVPVYNVEEYIRECIKSIQAQTYSNIEIIVINDGTKDKSIEIISETTLLSFVHQIGVQGAIALICIFYFMSKEVLEKVQKNSQFKNRFLFYVPMILIFVSIYQANTYTPQCITLLMITLGGFVGMRDRRRKKYNG